MKNKKTIYLVVKDEEGILRPQAGIWEATEYSHLNTEKYLKNNKEDTIVAVVLTEIV
jgi:hypothetical protein